MVYYVCSRIGSRRTLSYPGKLVCVYFAASQHRCHASSRSSRKESGRHVGLVGIPSPESMIPFAMT
jgi:hypothetical protein